MTLIINAGSENKGGTFKQAKLNADHWLECIHDEGFPEVIMNDGKKIKDGDYEFQFTHSITKKSVLLHIHGFTTKQCEEFTFHPRVYWNGSSCSDPKIEDWLTEGFKYRVEYYNS